MAVLAQNTSVLYLQSHILIPKDANGNNMHLPTIVVYILDFKVYICHFIKLGVCVTPRSLQSSKSFGLINWHTTLPPLSPMIDDIH